MNEMVERPAAKAGASGLLANSSLAKRTLRKKKVLPKKSNAGLPGSLRAQDGLNRQDAPSQPDALNRQHRRNQVLTPIDNIPDLETDRAPRRASALIGSKDGWSAPAGKAAEPGLDAPGFRRVAGELFTFDRDRTGADRIGEIIAATRRLR